VQSFYAESFEREMGCTQAEWLMWLPGAIGPHAYEIAAQTARVQIGAGRLALGWQQDAPRRIALASIPRLRVSFRFSGLDEAQRYAFMQRFDLYMQRGGG
jgi:hypothetical protein